MEIDAEGIQEREKPQKQMVMRMVTMIVMTEMRKRKVKTNNNLSRVIMKITMKIRSTAITIITKCTYLITSYLILPGTTSQCHALVKQNKVARKPNPCAFSVLSQRY